MVSLPPGVQCPVVVVAVSIFSTRLWLAGHQRPSAGQPSGQLMVAHNGCYGTIYSHTRWSQIIYMVLVHKFKIVYFFISPSCSSYEQSA